MSDRTPDELIAGWRKAINTFGHDFSNSILDALVAERERADRAEALLTSSSGALFQAIQRMDGADLRAESERERADTMQHVGELHRQALTRALVAEGKVARLANLITLWAGSKTKRNTWTLVDQSFEEQALAILDGKEGN